MTLRIRNPLKTAVLAGAAACLLAQTASAAVYVIRKDPSYGGLFPALGWRASAELFVSESCLTSVGSGSVTVTLGSGSMPASCATSGISNAELEFYSPPSPLTTLEAFSIGSYAASAAGGNGADLSQELLSLTFANGEVVDFETSYSDPLLGGATGNDLLALGVPLDTFFALNLSLNVDPSDGGDGNGGGLRAFNRPPSNLNSNLVEIPGGASAIPSEDTITRIPEPGTLALALAALTAVFTLGRRRSR